MAGRAAHPLFRRDVAGMKAASDQNPGETRRQREARVREEIYKAWIDRDAIYAAARRKHDAAAAVRDERNALAARLEMEDLEASARRFSKLVAREQIWGAWAPFVALFPWLTRRR